MQNNGFPRIRAAIKGSGSVEDGIEWLKSFDIVVHPRCKHTIDELTMYSYKIDPITQNVLPVLDDKHNHVIDALRYACESARKATKPAPTVTRVIQPIANGWMG
jgi:phage terminase large subunit